MRKLVRHKWISIDGKYIGKYYKCVYCSCRRYFSKDIMKYIYANDYNNILYRAPDCKRVYLSDKI